MTMDIGRIGIAHSTISPPRGNPIRMGYPWDDSVMGPEQWLYVRLHGGWTAKYRLQFSAKGSRVRILEMRIVPTGRRKFDRISWMAHPSSKQLAAAIVTRFSFTRVR